MDYRKVNTVMPEQVNSNTAVQTQEAPKMPALAKRNTAAGKHVGYVQHFTGSLSAKMIKEKLKAAGKKGKELTAAVNETLKGEKDLREQLGAACYQAAIQAGYVPDCFEENKAQNKGVFRMVKLEAAKPVTVEDQIKALQDAKAAGGLSAEQLVVIKALAA